MITHIRRQTERLELDHLSLRFFSPPSSKCLVLLMGHWFFHLHSVHSSLRTCFLRSYLRLPWACLDSADFLYWVTFIFTCLLHLAQYVLRALGMFTMMNCIKVLLLSLLLTVV